MGISGAATKDMNRKLSNQTLHENTYGRKPYMKKIDWTGIPGWLTIPEGEILRQHARGCDVLELGSYQGRSTVAMAQVAKSVTSVDWHHGDTEVPDENTLENLKQNLEDFGVTERVDVIDRRIEDFSKSLENGSKLRRFHRYHTVFIDAAHDEKSAERDTRLAMDVLLPGGTVIWHDWHRPTVRAGAESAGIKEFMVEQFENLGVLKARKWQVALVCPHYGQAHFGVMRTALESSGRIADIVPVADIGSSALPHAFNGLLIQALQWRDQGLITHLLMCHADVAPARGSLDVITEEMARFKTVVLSAVIPIKEPYKNPRTSTAVGSLEDEWNPKWYVHVNDYGKMPDTFSGDDVCMPGEVLLVNSGYALFDLTRAFWDEADFAFEFKTKIDREMVNGKMERYARFQSEDWLMSRHLHRCGVPYHATWKPEITHYGNYGWKNRPGDDR